MNIRSSLTYCLLQHGIDQLYDRGIVDIVVYHLVDVFFRKQICSLCFVVFSRLRSFGITVILVNGQHDLV